MMEWGSDQYELVRIPIRKACKGYYLRWYYNGWHYWFFQLGVYTINTEGEKYRTIGTRKINMGSGQISRTQAQAIRTIMNTREVYLLTLAGWANVRIEPGSLNIYDSKLNGTELELTAVIGSKEISYDNGFTPVDPVPVVDPDPYVEGDCEIVIGTQIWMCKNYDTNYPGSKVYGDDEANRAIYGGLYTFTMAKSPGFCPDGWHVPTLEDWNILIEYVGGQSIAGRELKEIGTDHWGPANLASDTYGFAALGAGMFSSEFVHLKEYAKFWTDQRTFGGAFTVEMSNTDIAVQTILELATYFQSVRLIKDTPYVGVPYEDWFLPSRYELLKMYTNLKSGTDEHFVAYTPVGGFSDAKYQSSSEYTSPATQNIAIDFTDGSWWTSSKGVPNKVRPCRVFTDLVGAYSLRDTGPAGGLIFYVSGTTYYEAAPVDIADKQFSNIITALNTTSYDIGQGQDNTNKIIAQIINATGWFLPSRDELGLMLNNLHLFGVGNFAEGNYWSSSEATPTNAWYGSFITHSVALHAAKGNLMYIRACRSFVTTNIYSLRDVGPSDGLIFDVTDNEDGTFTYFEAATLDQGINQPWSNITNILLASTSTVKGTGQANTLFIISQFGHTNSAAQICNDLIKSVTSTDSAAGICDALIVIK